jgi:hypothetical protein
MRNELEDLNDYLFAEMERLNKEGMTEAQVAMEVIRAKAISEVATNIVNSQALGLKAYDLFDGSFGKRKLPSFFRKALSNATEEKANGDKTEEESGKKPLLQFRGSGVSQKRDNGPKLLGIENAL